MQAAPEQPAPTAASDALKAAGDIIKVSTGLATGALVFSVSLLPNAWTYTPLTRALLVVSWFLLLVSIVAGILSQAAIPVLMADQNYDIENKFYTWPGRAHQLSFGLAVAILAFALITIVYSEPSYLRVHTAADAIARARSVVDPQFEVRRVAKIELIKDPSDRASYSTWHAQLEIVPKGASNLPSQPPVAQSRFLDVFITARKGAVSTLP
jgi:hypothetical protein